MADRESERIVASFEVLINNNKLDPEAEAGAFHLEVTDGVGEIGMFSLSLNSWDANTGEMRWLDDDMCREGNEVRIKMGFKAPLSEVMVGEITAVEPEFRDKDAMVLTLRGYDRLYRLGYGRKSRSFRNMKDSDIASQIAQEWGLTAETDDSSVTHQYLFQNNQTDLDFLLARARLIRYEVKVKGKSLLFRKPPEKKGKVASLVYGEDLLEFMPRLSILPQITGAVAQGWSPKEKKIVTGQAGDGDVTTLMGGKDSGAATVKRLVGKAPEVIVGEGPETAEEAEMMAKGRMNAAAFDLVTGEGSCIGDPEIVAGAVIEIKGVGKRFSGLYYVTSVTHSISVDRGYVTTFSVRRSAA